MVGGEVGQQVLGALGDVLRVEAEVLEHDLAAGADAPKRSMPTVSSAQRSQPKVAPASTESVGTLGRQHVVLVRRRSARRRAPSTASTRPGRAMPSAASSVGGVDAERDLGAGADEDDVGVGTVGPPVSAST